MEIRSSLPNVQAYNTATQNAAVEPRQAEQTRQSEQVRQNRDDEARQAREANQVRPVANAEGQTTGTLINVTA